MRSQLYIDTEIYPPFEGFPRECIEFLRQLKKNNTREWFNKHKMEYEDFVKLPMQSFIATLRGQMVKFAPEIVADPKRSMFRIYRDIRFSRNKVPYKTHVAAVFHLRGKWQNSAGYYVHIEPGSVYAGGGIYLPNSKQLKKIRTAIIERAKEFLEIVESGTFVKKFKNIEGEKLKRLPQGFPSDHWMAEWLKYKSLYAGVEWDEEVCYTPKFVDKVVQVYKDLLPFVRFLNRGLGK